MEMITTQKEIRKLFWQENPNLSHKRINYGGHKTYLTDTRCAFVEFVDNLHRNGQISDKMVQKVTLS